MTATEVPKKSKDHASKKKGKGKKKDKSALPKMTYEERRAKFLKHNKSVRVNKPGSHKRVVCFGCRKPGHRMEKCPEKDQATHICFNCGSERHALRDCPQPSAGDDLPFAQCFVCGTQGHLSSKCPQNSRGLYPNGGCCFRCKGVDHLSHACPLKPKAPERPAPALVESGSEGEGPRPSKPSTAGGGGSEDMAKRSREGAEPAKGGREDRRPSATSGGEKASKKPKSLPQSWKAVGGDDLGDGDFALEDFMEREEEEEEDKPRPQQRNKKFGRAQGKDGKGSKQQQQAPGVSTPAPTGARKPATRVVTF